MKTTSYNHKIFVKRYYNICRAHSGYEIIMFAKKFSCLAKVFDQKERQTDENHSTNIKNYLQKKILFNKSTVNKNGYNLLEKGPEFQMNDQC